MRVAVLIDSPQGQVCGITSDEALRLGTDGKYVLDLPHGLRLTVIVDAAAEPLPAARVGALPWPSDHETSPDTLEHNRNTIAAL
jgi:Lon protease-like protein